MKIKSVLRKVDVRYLKWVAVILVGGLCLIQLQSNDLWWHLANGRFFVQMHEIAIRDPFSWTHQGQRLLFVPWIPSVLMYLTHLLGGVPGLIILKFTVAAAWAGLCLYRNSEKRVNHWWLLPVFLLSIWLTLTRLGIMRSSLTPFILLPLMILASDKVKNERYQLVFFAVLILFWVNSHGSYIIGILWVGLHYSRQVLEQLLDRQNFKIKHVGFVSFSMILVLCCSLLSPSGLSVWETVFQHSVGSGTQDIFQITNEARPIQMFDLMFLKVAAVFLFSIGFPPFLFLSWKKFGAEKLFWLFTFLLIFKEQRFTGYFGMTSLLFLPNWLTQVSKLKLTSTLDWIRKKVVLICYLFVFLWMPVWFLWALKTDQPVFPKEFGWNIRYDRFPESIVQFMKKNLPLGRLYNSPYCGGYLIWFLPEYKVFMDGRTVVLYDEAFFHNNYGKYMKNNGFANKLSELNLYIAIVSANNLAKQLYSAQNWVPVCFDDRWVLFLRKEGENAELIRASEYKYLKLFDTFEENVNYLEILKSQSPNSFQLLGLEIARAIRSQPYESTYLALYSDIYHAIESQEE